MKENRLARCLGNVNPKNIKEAEQYRKQSRTVWIKWGSLAACLCLAIASALYFGIPRITPGPGVINPPDSSNPATHHGDTALYVPKNELPEINAQDGDVQMDMIGLVVYKGRIYTQAESFYGERATIAESLLGERLGTTKDSINEWSTQNDYATEFASSIGVGDVYTVKGYSPDFRICVRTDSFDEFGNPAVFCGFYENLNGIYLRTGQDIFRDRLRLSENWERAEY